MAFQALAKAIGEPRKPLRRHADRKVLPLNIASRNFFGLAALLSRALLLLHQQTSSVATLRLRSVGYAIGLIDNAVRNALAKRVADRRICMGAIRQSKSQARRCTRSRRSWMNWSVIFTVALAGAIGDDRSGSKRQGQRTCTDRPSQRTAWRAFLRISLVAHIGPQLVAFDPVHANARPSCGRADRRSHGRPRSASLPTVSRLTPVMLAHGANAQAFGQSGDDCNLLVHG